MTAAIVLATTLLLLGCRYFGGIAAHPVIVFPDEILEAGAADPSEPGDDASALEDRIESHKLVTSRKLLAGNSCTSRDISISQGRDSSSSGIPQYVVQIVNTCISDCAPSNIHVFCGWFASAPLVNPRAFRRLNYDDCLVNDGKPLRHGEIIRFQYANSFMYPLRFKSAKFC